MRAASPRARTSAMIAATAASTSAWVSRLAFNSAWNCASNAGVRVSSSSGIGRLAEFVDPVADLLRPGLERGAVHHQARGDIGNVLDLDEAIGAERGTGLHEIDDAPAEPERRRQLHRAVQLDA